MLETQLERIANALEALAAVHVGGCSGNCSIPAGETSANAEPAPDPEWAKMDREALLAACAERGIDVPKGTKTPTLVKQLEAWTPPEEEAPPTPNTVVTGETVGPEIVEDIFGDEGEGPRELTRDDVRAQLEKVLAAKGQSVVKEILSTFGGVKMFKDLPDEKLEAVMDAAETECP